MPDDKPPRLPDVHVVRVEGDYAEVVSSPICDFCGDKGPTWDYGCDRFFVEEVPSPFVPDSCFGSEGGWAACDVCARLVDGRELAKLMIRQGLVGVPYEYSALILLGFFENMDGTKVPFG